LTTKSRSNAFSIAANLVDLIAYWQHKSNEDIYFLKNRVNMMPIWQIFLNGNTISLNEGYNYWSSNQDAPHIQHHLYDLRTRRNEKSVFAITSLRS
jgi:hypothetical protein